MLFFLSKIFKSNTIKTSILQLIQPDILAVVKLYQSLKPILLICINITFILLRCLLSHLVRSSPDRSV